MAITRLDITSRTPFPLPGLESLSYERIDGIAHFACDPAAPANEQIADLAIAERGTDGLVHFDADFCLLVPAGGGTRRLLFDVANRGGKTAMVFVNRGARPLIPTPEIDPGDAFLMRHGWTVAWCGWQWDVPVHPGMIGLRAPQALGPDGQPVRGLVRVLIQGATVRAFAGLKDESLGPSLFRAYPAADTTDPSATLSVREHADGPATVIPRERWQFAKVDADGTVVTSDSHVRLEGGFQPGKVYEVIYRTRSAPVVGTGLLAVRDFVSFLRNERDAAASPCAGTIDAAHGFGVSQSGRLLRTFLYHGQNLDEASRQVFDGVMPVVAGSRRGEFNVRFGQPSSELTSGVGHLPPYRDDGANGAPGLLDRQRALGGVPKILNVLSATEYWRGDASLLHTSEDGLRDLPQAAETRNYLIASTQHGFGFLPFMRANPISGDAGRHPFNVVDSRLPVRALIERLDQWVRKGVEPPANAIPTLAQGTLTTREDAFERLAGTPGVYLPDIQKLRVVPRLALQENGLYEAVGSPCVSMVSAVDPDGNEVAGIRLPDISEPIATHTGWNPRDPATGGMGQVLRLSGSTLPFAPDPASRLPGDRRAPLSKRYAGREEYEARVHAAARVLAGDGYILEEDVPLAVANCMDRWDAVAAGVNV